MSAGGLLLLLLLGTQPTPDVGIDGPPLEWVTEHAPYGMDITLDGKLWINTNRVGATDDYAILANDLYKALTNRSSNPRFWVRGYHIKNARAAYRETKTLVSIDCSRDTIWVERKLYYAASGEVLDTAGPFSIEPIVPGSVGESWRRAACGS